MSVNLRIRRFHLVAILCLIVSAPSFCQIEVIESTEPDSAVRGWSLDSCIVFARVNNIKVIQSALDIDVSKINLKEAKAALFPSLTFSTSQNMAFVSKEEEKSVYQGMYSLDAGVTIYDGGRNIKNIRMQKLSIESAQYNYLATANSIELLIIQAYYQILYTIESVRTNTQIVETSAQQLDRSQALFNVGNISKVDLAQMESQYKSDIYQFVVAKTAYSNAVLNLEQLLQLSPDARFMVNVPNLDSLQTLASVPNKDEVIQIALSSLPEVKGALSDIQIAQVSRDIAKGERLPTITLRGSVESGHVSTSQYSYGTQLTNSLNENVGLSMSVPIFNNLKTQSNIRRAQVAILNSELNLENIVLDITNTISSLHLDAVSSQVRYDAAMSNIRAARESYDLMEEKYNIGLQNAVDLLVEKNKLLSAIQDMIQAKYSALLALRMLDFYQNPYSGIYIGDSSK